ncbi:MAG TPA: CoA pyrophosphatase [Thermoanaerobaculia bacterium]|nr:CoA pyrophosphatase [Thermoanaerobaculia bacterium]
MAFEIDRLRAALRRSDGEPGHLPGPTAAVAAILRGDEPDAPELLLIERAARERDPWSGQIAMPGGRRDPADPSPAATAERETREEVGIDLSRAERLGRLPDQSPASSRLRLSVSAHVYWLGDSRPRLRTNHEVEATLWVPLADLTRPDRYRDYRYPIVPDELFPAVALDEQERVVWGLTLRFLEDLFRCFDHPFPVKP